MFSYSGNFKNDCFDGVVCEIDVMTGECMGVIKPDLWGNIPLNFLMMDLLF